MVKVFNQSHGKSFQGTGIKYNKKVQINSCQTHFINFIVTYTEVLYCVSSSLLYSSLSNLP